MNNMNNMNMGMNMSNMNNMNCMNNMNMGMNMVMNMGMNNMNNMCNLNNMNMGMNMNNMNNMNNMSNMNNMNMFNMCNMNPNMQSMRQQMQQVKQMQPIIQMQQIPQNSFENENINIIFKLISKDRIQPPITIYCRLDDKISHIIEKYRTKSLDNDYSEKFVLNAKTLDPSKTLREECVYNEAQICVISTKFMEGGNYIQL